MRFNHDGVIGEIDNLPGCSQVAVFHSVFAHKGIRGTGRGTTAHKKRIIEAAKLGYDVAICTADLNNTAQIAILDRAGWLCMHVFESSKTGHTVGIFVKDI